MDREGLVNNVAARRLKRRWSKPGSSRITVPGVPHYIPAQALAHDQITALVCRVRLDEITTMLVSGQLDLGEVNNRSPSPEPVYETNTGRRINTREQRKRDKLGLEREHLVRLASTLSPSYRPPGDYRPVSLQKKKKIYIPVDKYPEYNFIGIIIGPRGSTQKRLERETGAKISIRGKGSTKGKDWGRRDGKPTEGENEPLHVIITADTDKSLRHAAEEVKKLLVPIDDSQNEHKQRQLRELAIINGTLRDQTWSAPQHVERTWSDAKVKCEHCGEASHPSVDCPFKGTAIAAEYQKSKKQIDDEYSSFFSEIGGSSAPRSRPPPRQHSRGPPRAPPPRREEDKKASEEAYKNLMADLDF